MCIFCPCDVCTKFLFPFGKGIKKRKTTKKEKIRKRIKKERSGGGRIRVNRVSYRYGNRQIQRRERGGADGSYM